MILPPESILSAKRDIAARAQEIYNSWQVDKDGLDIEFGGGGACDAVNREIQDVISSHFPEWDVVDGGQEGDDHAYSLMYDYDTVYLVDIPPGVYELGAGYSWRKIPGVVIGPENVTFVKVDYISPEDLKDVGYFAEEKVMSNEYPESVDQFTAYPGGNVLGAHSNVPGKRLVVEEESFPGRRIFDEVFEHQGARRSNPDREPIESFLDRYIPDWSSLSYGELIKEFNGIPITFEFVDSGDRKVTGDQVAEYIAGTKTSPPNTYVRYFAPGTAAYDEPQHLYQRTVDVDRVIDAIDELSEQGLSPGGVPIDAPGHYGPTDLRRLHGGDQFEPFEDFLNRYVPNWRRLAEQPGPEGLTALGDEIDRLRDRFTFTIYTEPDQDWLTIPWMELGEFLSGNAVRYFAPGTAAFAMPADARGDIERFAKRGHTNLLYHEIEMSVEAIQRANSRLEDASPEQVKDIQFDIDFNKTRIYILRKELKNRGEDVTYIGQVGNFLVPPGATVSNIRPATSTSPRGPINPLANRRPIDPITGKKANWLTDDDGNDIGFDDLTPEDEQRIEDINRYISEMRTYGRRQEQVVSRNPKVLVWSNGSAEWYISRLESEGLRVGSTANLDANMLLVYGTMKQIERILDWLNPLPLYGLSYEGRARNVAMPDNMMHNPKTGQWTDKLTGKVYPDPEHIAPSTGFSPNRHMDANEELPRNLRTYNRPMPGKPGVWGGQRVEDIVHHVEPVTDFLDRYISDWRNMTPEELASNIHDLPIHLDGFEVYEPEDAEFVVIHLNGYDQSVRGVRYYPRGSAAYDEPENLKYTSQHDREPYDQSIEDLRSMGVDPHTMPSTHTFEHHEDGKTLPSRRSSHQEPLSDFLDRYISDWRKLDYQSLHDEIEYLHDQFLFDVKDTQSGSTFVRGAGITPLIQNSPGWVDRAIVRYYPAGTAAFSSPLGDIKFTHMTFSPDALDALLETSQIWEEQARVIIQGTSDSSIRIRANFAANVAFIAAKSLQSGKADVLVAYTDSGILGISVYKVYQDRTALISLVTVAPDLQPGTPGPKIKGIGTGMLCAVAEDLHSKGVHQVCLKPLDDQAEKFWRNRGFQTTGVGKLCVIDGVDKLVSACERPDDPEAGDCIHCGDHEQVAAYTKPSVAAFLST